MSTTQKTINIPYWLTNGSGWQVSSQGNCRVTVTRNFGDNFATVSTYWGYCSPGGSQASVNCIINANGTVQNQTIFESFIKNSGQWYYGSGSTFNVSVSDSAGELPIQVYMYVNAGSSGQQSSVQSSGFAFESRGETIPALNKTSAEMGTGITITTNPYVSDFNHKLYYSIDNLKTKVSIGNVASGTTSTNWTIPTSLATSSPNNAILPIQIICETYNGSDKVGDYKTVMLNATVPTSYKPTISNVAITENTSGLASKFGCYVQNKTTLKIITTAIGSNGSSVNDNNISVKCNGFTYKGKTITTGIIDKSGTVNIEVSATDSRGRTTTTTKTINVVAYSPPSITKSKVSRATQQGVLSDDGLYALFEYTYSISPVNNKNDKTFTIQYFNGSAWQNITSFSDYARNTNYLTTQTYNADASHRFRFLATDYFSTASIELSIETTFTLMNFGSNGKSMAIGMLSPNDGYFDVNLLTRIRKSINIMSDLVLGDNAKSYIWNWLKPKTDALYSVKSHTHPITFSSNEVNTGDKWVDGKPIYRVSFSGTTNASSDTTNVWCGITNVKEVVDIKGSINTTYGYTTIGSYYNDTFRSFVEVLPFSLANYIANEDEQFTLAQSTNVRFGYGDKWVSKTLSAGTYTGNTSTFGSDPYNGQKKIIQVVGAGTNDAKIRLLTGSSYYNKKFNIIVYYTKN